MKGCIVSIDATPFKLWFEMYYTCKVDAKGELVVENLIKAEGENKSVIAKPQKRQASIVEQKEMIEQFVSDKLLDCISSRPSQSGNSDGYTLEDEEYVFYKKINHKKK